MSAARRIRIVHFCPWAGLVQDGADFVRGLPAFDVRSRVTNPDDPGLVRMARLDCDWHGENVRAFGALRHDEIEFLPMLVVGVSGVAALLTLPTLPGEERWFVIGGQHPDKLGAAAGRAMAALRHRGYRILYYAFDEASRAMPCFRDIAPHLSVLIHDELPLDPGGSALLGSDCLTTHRSWVANLVPFAAPFEENPREGIVFLGSKLGLTPHRRRQIEHLQGWFKDRFTAICDHSLAVSDRAGLTRFKVGFCPEGRKFGTPAMSASHTDRPFWSGCLGMVPVSEDSKEGGRLEDLHRAGLIERYARADLGSLTAACERALAASPAERRRIYEHFNRRETIGSVVADAIHESGRMRRQEDPSQATWAGAGAAVCGA